MRRRLVRDTAVAMLAGMLLIGSSGHVHAADTNDPDWPCVQRKVEHLSLAAMWPDPIRDDVAALPEDLEEAAGQLALRRVSDEEAQAIIDRIAQSYPESGSEDFGRMFQATFEHIDRQRSEIIAGISRYARNQARLAAELEEFRAEMARLETAAAPDFDRMDEVEAEIDWRVRIFNDRSRALTYVCESPVLLEQRAFSIARMMLKAAG